MKDISEVSAYIRFQLNQLSTKNAHHGFEDLCFHLAQARICSNILPATGPVAAGGDQGRDFETFESNIKTTPTKNSTFVGLKCDKKIVFACSTSKAIINKIKKDIKKNIETIESYKSPVDKIVYFCTEDVPVAKRHELEKWAKENYSMKIEIFDGNAITNLLVDNEVFWIAVKYLDITSEIYPKSEDEEDWYLKSLENWKSGNIPLINNASFYEIKKSLRHAVFTQKAKQDIPFWIDILEKEFINNDFSTDLKRLAMYEISVASFKGLGTLINRENLLREFFEMIPDLKSTGELEDYSVLLNYCSTAVYNGLLRMKIDDLISWHNLLREKIDKKLETNDINLKCQLLELRGFSRMTPSEKGFEVNNNKIIQDWIELAKLAENAPFFPINRFSNRLTKLTKFLGNHEQYEYLTGKIDLLLSKRYGDYIAARNCTERAVEFYNNGEILKAINQLHQAKVKWFIEETLFNSLISTIFISKCYLELGLSFAAKYYALAASYIAISSSDKAVKSFSPRALFIVAENEYMQGSWCGFLEFLNIAIQVHLNLSENPLGVHVHKELERVFYAAAMLIFITESYFEESLNNFVTNTIDELPVFKDDLNEMAKAAQKNFQVNNIKDLWLILEKQMNGRPFGDCGSQRTVSWSELGIIWNIKWENEYIPTSISEQFMAILQIFLAELVNIDLCLLKTEVNISIEVDNIEKPKVESIPSNNGRKWKITFPAYENVVEIDDLQIQFVEIIKHILYEVSLLSVNELNEIINNSLKSGILSKVFIAESYLNLYNFFIDSDTFEDSERKLKVVPEFNRSFNIKSYDELKWFDGPGPRYNKENAEKNLEIRYKKSIPPIKYTIKRLSKNPEFVSTIQSLRADGWLDWHILLVINNIAVNYRIDQNIKEYTLTPSTDMDSLYQNEWEMVINEEEKKNSTVIPVSLFKEDELRLCLHGTMIHTLEIYGLECKQTIPDLKAIEHFLQERYNYWKDDIEHDKLF